MWYSIIFLMQKGEKMPLKCPLCGGLTCSRDADHENNSLKFTCNEFQRSVNLSVDIAACLDEDEKRKRENLVFEHCLREPTCNKRTWRYFYDPSYDIIDGDTPNLINLARISYPKSFSEKADRVLLNLFRVHPDYADLFSKQSKLARAFFAETEKEENNIAFADVLTEVGYLTSINNGSFRISADGWKRIEELTRKEQEIKQGFIAMSFSNKTSEISKAFKRAITESGYTPIRIDEKEHNNQIVPEILFEIDRSKFLVMDVTVPNYGAYYEAGYALGKGKQVIICCRKEEFEGVERPHFDIQQKSTIVWNTEDDLVKRLKKRIETTVL